MADSLATDFTHLWANDPIFIALNEGKMRWADILLTPEEEENDRLYREERNAVEAAERAARDALVAAAAIAPSYKKHVTFEKPSTAASERVVPAFPAGRRTLMAKNLPRDIEVQELRTVFEKFGAIRDIYIPKNMDRASPYFGTIKGFAKIQFLKPEDSATAFAAQYALLNIRGKNIVLEPAAEDR